MIGCILPQNRGCLRTAISAAAAALAKAAALRMQTTGPSTFNCHRDWTASEALWRSDDGPDCHPRRRTLGLAQILVILTPTTYIGEYRFNVRSRQNGDEAEERSSDRGSAASNRP